MITLILNFVTLLAGVALEQLGVMETETSSTFVDTLSVMVRHPSLLGGGA